MQILHWLKRKKTCIIAGVMVGLAGCSAQQHHFSGLNAMDKGEYPKAIAELQQAAELHPLDVEYQRDWLVNREAATNKLLQRADSARMKGSLAEAGEAFRTILKYEPSNARALAGLGAIAEGIRANEDVEQAQLALKRNDSTEALRYASRALDRMPEHAEARKLKTQIERGLSRELTDIPSLGKIYKKPVNLEFRDASVKMVFDALSRTTGINFVYDRDVNLNQRTTVLVKQTKLEDAIDVLLTTNQLEKKVLNETSVLIYPNTPGKLKEYQELLVKAFYLSNVDAKTAANLLKSVLKLKDIYVDEKYHMLVLRENAETIALAEKLIALQDLEEPEVMLEVEVLEVSRNKLLNLGVQVTNQFTVSPLGVTSGGSNSATMPLSDLLHLNKNNLGITAPSATINLQKSDGDANLLANPRLRVRDRDKAKILIGDKVPVVTSTTTPNGFLSENVQYLDVGLKLEVEPEIHLRDEVGLKLSLEVSSLVGSVKTSTGTQAYQIGTRTISSSLRLRDGETQVLAGLISDADRSDANRIPLLGDVPLLGRLFSSQKDDRRKTEIVMSITPHLIRNIQRKNPVAETFWSGTESNLRTRPVYLGAFAAETTTTAPANAPAMAPAGQLPAVPDNSGLALAWKAPKTAKAGEVITLELGLETSHQLRAAPLQVAYNSAAFDVMAVEAGDFFARDGKAQFSQMIDKASGRISIGTGSSDGKSATGSGSLVKLKLRVLSGVSEGEVALIGMTPVGSQQSVPAPVLPKSTQMAID